MVRILNAMRWWKSSNSSEISGNEDHYGGALGNGDRNFEFEQSVAAKLHDAWRKAREEIHPGVYAPRNKEFGGKTFDIANLTFDKLPTYFKFENLVAAKIATVSLSNAYVAYQSSSQTEGFITVVNNPEFIESASALQHERWLLRNSDKAWVAAEQKLSYRDLPEIEKNKDRLIVHAAIEALREVVETK